MGLWAQCPAAGLCLPKLVRLRFLAAPRRSRLCRAAATHSVLASCRLITSTGPAATEEAGQLPKSLQVAWVLGQAERGFGKLAVLRCNLALAGAAAGLPVCGGVVGLHRRAHDEGLGPLRQFMDAGTAAAAASTAERYGPTVCGAEDGLHIGQGQGRRRERGPWCVRVAATASPSVRGCRAARLSTSAGSAVGGLQVEAAGPSLHAPLEVAAKAWP
mmetsp:Transcript_70166/g.227115  ORF Transcript_70166/g.227115 Transcript_70166/m.227115 type:complete len:216 (+) Transcript_70166:595-1242(+)